MASIILQDANGTAILTRTINTADMTRLMAYLHARYDVLSPEKTDQAVLNSWLNDIFSLTMLQIAAYEQQSQPVSPLTIG